MTRLSREDGLDAERAIKLADEFAKRLKVRPKRQYQIVRDQLLDDLLPKGTTYEQVQGYKRFLDRQMQRRARVVRERLRSQAATRRI